MEASRNEIFQLIKPHCVRLSQLALTYGKNPAQGKELIQSIDVLRQALSKHARPGSAFDAKLAEYVFFPLSHVFRQSQKVPERALELTLQCLILLLKIGWNRNLPKEIGSQLLILLTFIAGGNSIKTGAAKSSEELQQAAFDCISALSEAFRQSGLQDDFAAAANVPSLAQAVTATLDGITGGASTGIQLSALSALGSIHKAIDDKEALASFLPATVSSITKVLQVKGSSRRSWRVLAGSLNTLSDSLISVLDDSLLEEAAVSEQEKQNDSDRKVLTMAWFKATAAQVRMALSNILHLRYYDRSEVCDALLALCAKMVEHCRKSLPDLQPMMIESIICLSKRELRRTSETGYSMLKRLVLTDPSVLESINSSLHNWILALPRIMQSNDERPKRRMLEQLSTAYRVLSDTGNDSELVDGMMAVNLRDSVTAAFLNNGNRELAPLQSSMDTSLDLVPSETQRKPVSEFPAVLEGRDSQKDTIIELQSFLRQLEGSKASLFVAREMIAQIRSSSGEEFLAGFWLSLSILTNAFSSGFAMEDYVEIGASERSQLLDELYSFSLSILASPWSDGERDWRAQSMALEVVALQARQQKTDFRLELVDTLYPIVHLMGSAQANIRSHAIVCLNIIAEASGFLDTRNLIVSNVDYLVNAIALKLNTFDISPQAPQVLLMMIKLTGPSLLPYLDDLTESIFAALDNFHGYPRLVELLFSVLGGIVEEGAKSETLAISFGKDVEHAKPARKTPAVSDIVVLLSQRRAARLKDEQSDDPDGNHLEPAPKRPWKEEQSNLDSEHDEDSQDEDATSRELSKDPPAPPKSYTLLTRIMTLTQHYLTNPSPPLRSSLLRLVTTATGPLSRDEDVFLPLINTLWPVVIQRLQDPEAFVVVSAAVAIGSLCEAAGDFMASRIRSEWASWKRMCDGWVAEVAREASVGRGVHTPAFKVWTAWSDLLVSILDHVQVEEEMLDDVLELWTKDARGSSQDGRSALKRALERRNADAVWMEEVRQMGIWKGREVPEVDGFVFKEVGGW